MHPGRLIKFEGRDGFGRTTQLRLLASRLRGVGKTVVETVDPDGAEIGRQTRRILLDPEKTALHARTELPRYFANRAQNVVPAIRPALAPGNIVLCDRFTDSTLAYQGCGRGFNSGMAPERDLIACQGLKMNGRGGIQEVPAPIGEGMRDRV